MLGSMGSRVPLATNRRAAALPSCRASRAPVHVVAFRDQHRQQVLRETATEFSRGYGAALVKGPSPERIAFLGPESDSFMQLEVAHPLKTTTFKGLQAITLKLQTDHNMRYASQEADREAKVLFCATSDTDDVAFCLLELPPSLSNMSAAAMGDKEVGPQGTAQPSYMCLKMDLLIYDTARRVMRVEERAQLVSELDEERRAVRTIMARNQRELPEGTLMGAAFPVSKLQPWQTKEEAEKTAAETAAGDGHLPPAVHEGTEEGVVARAMGALKSYCQLSTSASKESAALEQIMDVDNFQLYDAYGVLPLLCFVGTTDPIDAKQYLDLQNFSKGMYDCECKVLDCAVADDVTAGVAQWSSHLYNKLTGKRWDIHGTEVACFNPSTGKVTATYLFRDAHDFEDRVCRIDGDAGQPDSKA